MIRELLAYGDMLENACSSGLISEGEFLLLDNITANYKIYETCLGEAMEGGIITDSDEKELREIRKRIFTNALRTVLKTPVTDNEKEILGVLKKALGLPEETLDQIELTVKKELKIE